MMVDGAVAVVVVTVIICLTFLLSGNTHLSISSIKDVA